MYLCVFDNRRLPYPKKIVITASLNAFMINHSQTYRLKFFIFIYGYNIAEFAWAIIIETSLQPKQIS